MSIPSKQAVRYFTATESGMRPSFVPMSSARFPANLRTIHARIFATTRSYGEQIRAGSRAAAPTCAPIFSEDS